MIIYLKANLLPAMLQLLTQNGYTGISQQGLCTHGVYRVGNYTKETEIVIDDFRQQKIWSLRNSIRLK